jgi:hypothetical protein
MNLYYKNIAIIIFLTMILSACYKDEGNYDYQNLNRVVDINGFESGEIRDVVKFETVLSISPEIVLQDNSSEVDLEYEWTLFYTKQTLDGYKDYQQIISTEKDLNYVLDIVDVPQGDHVLWFTVRNKAIGIEYKDYLKLRVSSHSFSKGDFFLYETSTGSELFIINSESTAFPAAYHLMTGGLELSGQPLGIGEMKIGKNYNVLIYTDQAPDYGAILDIVKSNYVGAASNTILDIDLYETFDLNRFETSDLITLWSQAKMLINGNYYFYESNTPSNYKPLIYLSLPTLEDIEYMSPLPDDKPILHQSSTGYIYYPSTRGSQTYYEVNISGQANEVPIAYPGKCLFIGKEPGRFSYGVRVLMEEDGMVKEYQLSAEENSTQSVLKLFDADGGAYKEFYSADFLTDNSLWTASLSTRYFYFSSGNIIYRYNYDNSQPDYEPEVFITLPEGSEITYIKMDGQPNGVLGMENKHLIVASFTPGQDNSGSVYYYQPDGTLIRAFENQCGKIVDRLNRD